MERICMHFFRFFVNFVSSCTTYVHQRLMCTGYVFFFNFLIFCNMLLLVPSGQYVMTMTAPFGMFAWSGVFLATAGLVMFYKCSR
jgi:hypothetical protein